MKKMMLAFILLSLIFVMGVSGCNSSSSESALQCPTISNPPCNSVSNGIGVSAVIAKDPCGCPSDTTYSGTTDVVTPGGPYKICICK